MASQIKVCGVTRPEEALHVRGTKWENKMDLTKKYRLPRRVQASWASFYGRTANAV